MAGLAARPVSPVRPAATRLLSYQERPAPVSGFGRPGARAFPVPGGFAGLVISAMILLARSGDSAERI